MDNLHAICPSCVIACYTPQRIPQFANNRLIEALPPPMSDEQLTTALTLLPTFDAVQRAWPAQDRLLLLGGLQNFMVPMLRHYELARALDSLLRAGYVGRQPRTPEHARIYQSIYEAQKAGTPFRQYTTSHAPQLSTSLIGTSGMGKTSTICRWRAHLPQVIYHPELNVYQVPVLHVEMPSDGASIKGLACGILHQLDNLIPGANYYHEYAVRGRPGADALMRNVARVMNTHLVGLLVGDEVQNLANSRKGEQTVMTELVSACNMLGVPIVFIGTNKARKVLSTDFRQSRRSTGHGLGQWDRLPAVPAEGAVDEWAEFLAVLWSFQWVRRPIPLDVNLRNLMHDRSQGVIDIAIKLFAACQARAILDGSESITRELIDNVYQRDFKLMHPMMSALRNNDLEALARYDDIAPLNLQDLLSSVERTLRGRASPLYSVKANDPTYVPRVAGSLVAAGFDVEEAEEAAKATQSLGGSTTVLHGVKSAVKREVAPQSRTGG